MFDCSAAGPDFDCDDCDELAIGSSIDRQLCFVAAVGKHSDLCLTLLLTDLVMCWDGIDDQTCESINYEFEFAI